MTALATMASFLSRLSRSASEPELVGIIRNLNQVFNARKGYGSVVSDFGLGDYDALLDGEAMTNALAGEITAAIRRYEPRLVDPAVELVGRDPKSWIRFRLSAEIGGARRHFHIDMDTVYREVVVALASSREDGGLRPGVPQAVLTSRHEDPQGDE